MRLAELHSVKTVLVSLAAVAVVGTAALLAHESPTRPEFRCVIEEAPKPAPIPARRFARPPAPTPIPVQSPMPQVST